MVWRRDGTRHGRLLSRGPDPLAALGLDIKLQDGQRREGQDLTRGKMTSRTKRGSASEATEGYRIGPLGAGRADETLVVERGHVGAPDGRDTVLDRSWHHDSAAFLEEILAIEHVIFQHHANRVVDAVETEDLFESGQEDGTAGLDIVHINRAEVLALLHSFD